MAVLFHFWAVHENDKNTPLNDKRVMVKLQLGKICENNVTRAWDLEKI